MPTRRQFCQSAAGITAGVAAAALVPATSSATMTETSMPETSVSVAPYAADKPLLQLQQEFLDLRFGMFLHFNMATYQDREWGDPVGEAAAFAPTALDTDGWARAAKAAGMGYGCLTTKHHDGFPIWPTATVPDHAEVDVVRAYVDSFRKAGLRVGLYYSILDLRHDVRHFNITPEKIAMTKAQLTELLTNYGEIDVLIFDGWDAPWSRITYEEMPFAEIYGLVKRFQPNCLISELNASQYPASALYYSDIKAFEQNAGQALPNESAIPAQSCVTLTDGWFWKAGDEARPLKSVKQVVEEWLIPQNERHCNLILNAAPNREGRLAPNLVARLEEIGRAWKNPGPAAKVAPSVVITTKNLATERPSRAIASGDTNGPDLANDGSFGNSWYLPEGRVEGWIEIDLPKGTSFNTLVLVEPVGKFPDYRESRIKAYRFFQWEGDHWVDLASGGVPSRVQIHTVARTQSDRIRVAIEASAETPHIAEIGVYDEPRG